MRAPESRLHLFVLGACVAGCVAVSMWPGDEPLPGPRAMGAEVKAALERTLGLDLRALRVRPEGRDADEPLPSNR